MEEQSGRVDPISLFPEDMQAGVQDLTFLGYLQRKVEFCGHVFVMETIRPYLKFTISQVLEPWRNTIKEPDVWAALNVGVALASINGNRSFCPPLQDDPRSFVEGRLYWLTGPHGYWQPVIDYLFAEYTLMEQEVGQSIVELHRLAERSRDTLQPSPGSWSVQGPSVAQIDGDTQPTESSS